MLLRDYLKTNAEFYSPQPDSSQQDSSQPDSSQTSISTVNDIEVNSLGEWEPVEARHDNRLVDSLVDVLNKRMGNTQISDELVEGFEFVKSIGRRTWEKNNNEATATRMVDFGALTMALFCSELVGCPFSLSPQRRAPNFQSKADYLFHDDWDHKIVVEVKSPNVFRVVEEMLFAGISALSLDFKMPNAGTAQNVLNKLCVQMAAHHSQWGVLTCHDKWLFVRLHRRVSPQRTYITFSTIEGQTSNTKPFRALLGTMLAIKGDVDVESNADLGARTVKIVEKLPGPPSPRSSLEPSDESSQGGRFESQELQPRSLLPSTPDIFLAWSRDVTSSNEWLSLYSVYGADGCPSIGCKSARLRLQREVGMGSTACVYEVKPDHSGQNPQTYAVKVVKKGKSEDSKRRLAGLYQEFKVYRVIEKARSEGRNIDMTPRCYGLYETAFTISLVMDYVGESLDGIEWGDLSQSERSTLFNTVWDLHAIGICHQDLAPRNVVRSFDDMLKIIDFESSTLHRCPSIRPVSQVSRVKGRDQCQELNSMWKLLGKPSIPHHGPQPLGPFKPVNKAQALDDVATADRN